MVHLQTTLMSSGPHSIYYMWYPVGSLDDDRFKVEGFCRFAAVGFSSS